MIGALLLAAAQTAGAPSAAAEKPILDRYYQCLVDQAIYLEQSRERADLVARAVVHRCREMFAEAATVLRTDKADAARQSGLEPEDAAGFAERFRSYSHDYALAIVVNIRAGEHS